MIEQGRRYTPRMRTSRMRRRFTRMAVLPAGIALAGLLAACSKPLLSPAETRSQYDRYDRVRSEYAQQYIEDEFGRKKPNIRGRLSPKD